MKISVKGVCYTIIFVLIIFFSYESRAHDSSHLYQKKTTQKMNNYSKTDDAQKVFLNKNSSSRTDVENQSQNWQGVGIAVVTGLGMSTEPLFNVWISSPDQPSLDHIDVLSHLYMGVDILYDKVWLSYLLVGISGGVFYQTTDKIVISASDIPSYEINQNIFYHFDSRVGLIVGINLFYLGAGIHLQDVQDQQDGKLQVDLCKNFFIGYERLLSKHLSMRIEYRYSKFEPNQAVEKTLRGTKIKQKRRSDIHLGFILKF